MKNWLKKSEEPLWYYSFAFAALLFVFLDFQFDIAAWPLNTLLIAAS